MIEPIDKEKIAYIFEFKVQDSEEEKNLTPWYATMYVKKEYRKRGYSKILNDAVLKEAKKRGMEFVCPSPIYCTDNAAMIGAAAYHYYLRKEFSGMDLNAIPYLPIYFNEK